jgi:DNA-binding response OmpR family regulator
MNLRRVSFDVTTTRTGEGASGGRRRRPDIVLLDLMLPDLSGTEVCRRLKLDRDPDIPVIMVTARGEESTGSWGSNWGG